MGGRAVGWTRAGHLSATSFPCVFGFDLPEQYLEQYCRRRGATDDAKQPQGAATAEVYAAAEHQHWDVVEVTRLL